MTGGAIAVVDGLVKRFPLRARGRGRQDFTAVDRVSFSIAAGETLGLVGETGAGKSTIARCLLGLETPTAGRIELFGRDAAAMSAREWKRVRRDLQPVFQDPKGAMNPRWPVGHLVGEPLRRLWSFDPAEVDERVRSSLAAVGLGAEFLGRYRHQLSGGQQQRVNIARAISVEPRCIVLDEPVAALDSSVKRDIVLLLNDLRLKRKLAFLLISHDLGVVRILCRRVIVLFRGRIVEMGLTRLVTASPRHPYTRELLAAQLDMPGDLAAATSVPAAEDAGAWSTEGGASPPRIGELVEIDKDHFVARDAV